MMCFSVGSQVLTDLGTLGYHGRGRTVQSMMKFTFPPISIRGKIRIQSVTDIELKIGRMTSIPENIWNWVRTDSTFNQNALSSIEEPIMEI